MMNNYFVYPFKKYYVVAYLDLGSVCWFPFTVHYVQF